MKRSGCAAEDQKPSECSRQTSARYALITPLHRCTTLRVSPSPHTTSGWSTSDGELVLLVVLFTLGDGGLARSTLVIFITFDGKRTNRHPQQTRSHLGRALTEWCQETRHPILSSTALHYDRGLRMVRSNTTQFNERFCKSTTFSYTVHDGGHSCRRHQMSG